MRKLVKRLCALFLVISIIFAMPSNYSFLLSISATENTVDFFGGSGIADDPYLVSTVEHLNNVRKYPEAHFRLVNDIVFSDDIFTVGGKYYNSGAGWEPIGTSGNPFKGVFDGGNFSIIGIRVSIPERSSYSINYAGIFGYVNGGEFRNLKVNDGYIYAYKNSFRQAYSGGIAAFCFNTIFMNCHNGNTVLGYNAGGMAGACHGGSVTDCTNSGRISRSSDGNFYGGILGTTSANDDAYGIARMAVTNCHNYGVVNGGEDSCNGGLIGFASSSIMSVEFCSNYGEIGSTSAYHAGGIIGASYNDIINCCFNNAKICGGKAGGIIGNNGYGFEDLSSVNNSYNIGTITAYHNYFASAGGISGNGGRINQCYNIGTVFANAATREKTAAIAAMESTPIYVNNSYASNTQTYSYSDGTTLCSLDELKKQFTYSGFDFDGIWSCSKNVNNGYPFLEKIPAVPKLSSESAISFVRFVTSGENPETQKKWKEEEICKTELYKILTNTNGSDNFGAMAQNLIVYTVSSITQRAGKAANSAAYLDKTIIQYLEKQISKNDNLDQELINEVYNTLSKNLTEAFYDLIDSVLPVAVDSLVSISDLYNSYCNLSGAVSKGKAIAEGLIATVYGIADIWNHNEAGACTYFIEYLGLRGSFRSQDDSSFRVLMDCERLNLGDKHWSAVFKDVIAPLTGEGSFMSEYDVLEEWAEYIYQLDCYLKLEDVETNATEVAEDKLECTPHGTTIAITATNNGLTGQIFLPNKIANTEVTRIDSFAFENQTALESVKLGDYIEVVGEGAFKNCTSLETVVIPANVTTIEAFAFENCTALQQVVIPDSAIYIGENAFKGCSKNLRIICNCDNSFVIGYCTENQIAYQRMHTFSEWETQKPATCINGSVQVRVCKSCKMEEERVLDYLAEHSYGNWVVGLPATEETEGIRYKVCSNCGDMITETIASLEPDTEVDAKPELPEGLQYTITDSTVAINNYSGTAMELIIPKTIEGFPVTAIDSMAFYNCDSLVTVIIPEGITSIGNYAFESCNNLVNISVPQSLTSLGEHIFYRCNNLLYNIYDNAKYLGNHKTPYLILMESTSDEITSCNIHIDTKIIYHAAFDTCENLQDITIPDGVISIGCRAFYWCTGLKSIYIPDGVTRIRRETFYNCKSLVSVRMPDSIAIIDPYVFACCSELQEIKIPESMTEIKANTFDYCSRLATITIPAGITKIHMHAFDYCVALKTIIFTGNKPSFEICWCIPAWYGPNYNTYDPHDILPAEEWDDETYRIFTDVTATAYYPDSNTTWTADALLNYGGQLTWVAYDMAESELKVYGDFVYSISDDKVTIRDYIGNDRELSIPDSICGFPVVYIGNYAFADCNSLSIVEIPDSVVEIGEYSFADNGSLKTVKLGSNVCVIRNGAFSESVLEEIVIPKSVTQIQNGAFSYCERLISIRFCGDVPSIDEGTFFSVNATLYYPSNNISWTETVLQNYGGTLVWIPYIDIQINKWNLTLNDSICMNFYVTVSEIETDNTIIEITVGNKIIKYCVTDANKTENTSEYLFAVDLAAAQMNDIVTVKIITDGEIVEEKNYNIRQYCDTILADKTHSQYHALVKEMLNYGAMAQIYFDYDAENLANDGITDVATTDVPDTAEELTVSDKISGLNFYGASLVYRDQIAVRYYFTGDVTGCTFSANGNTYTPVAKDGLYYVEIADILPQDLDQQIMLTVTDATGNTLTVTYGPMNYIVRMNEKGSAEMKNLLKALYNYHLAAKAL